MIIIIWQNNHFKTLFWPYYFSENNVIMFCKINWLINYFYQYCENTAADKTDHHAIIN